MNILTDIKKNFLTVFLYTLYGIICFMVFLLIKFPFDKVVDNAISGIENDYQYKITKQKSGYAFPIGVSFSGVEIQNTAVDSKPYQLEKLKITIPLSSIFFLKKEVNFSADGFEGKLDGSIRLDTDRISLKVDTSKEVEISKLLSGNDKKKMRLKGPAKFSFNIVMQKDSARTVSGNGQIDITGGQLENISPFLKSLKLDKAGFVFEATRGRGNVKNFIIEGSGVKINGGGTFKVGESLDKTNIKLKLFGEYDTSHEVGKAISLMGIKGKKNVPVELSGPISNLSIKVEGITLSGEKS